MTMVRCSLLGFALPLLAACSGEEQGAIDLASLDLRGTRIDGSEDAVAAEVAPERIELDVAATDESGDAAAPDEAAPEGEAPPAPTGADVSAEADAEVEPEEVGRLRADGVREISFWDLSLEGLDKEAIVDSLIFPEDYEDQEDLLPAEVRGLHGQRIAITGYMIPGRIARGGNVRDFMLVRDLLGCCFGGIPQPDEWIDVTMDEEATAEYVRYVPIEVEGNLTVGDDMDENAFNPAVFKMVATAVERKE